MPPIRRGDRSGSPLDQGARPTSSNSAASGPSSRHRTTIPGGPEGYAPYVIARSHGRPGSSHRNSNSHFAQMEHDALESLLQAAPHDLIDPSMQGADQMHQVHHDQQYAVQHAQPAQYGAHGLEYAMSGHQQAPMSYIPPQVQPEPETRRPRSSTGNQNDVELKELLARNKDRDLDDVSNEVRANERTSSAEKLKQLFAMLWLQKNLVENKGSVPRTRVHTQYAVRCARYHLQPLNPASFGKLVRVIFPNITTRRLGVRGESKYHYVDLALVDDLNAGTQNNSRQRSSTASGVANTHRVDDMQLDSIPRLQPDSTAIPSEEQSLASPVLSNMAGNSMPGAAQSASGTRVFPVPQFPSLDPPRPTAAGSYGAGIMFAPFRLLEHVESGDIQLIDIGPFLPPKTDEDAANALEALYLSHATSLVDCVRFCREKNFFRLFNAFQGTLTVPVQKLFIHPNLATWVRECDYLIYQKMIKVIAPLTLQAMPAVVMKFLHSVSQLLDQHIAKTFHSLPSHLMDAKLEPATIFCQLLQRMLRANQSAHAAGAILIDQEKRDRMWMEYAKFVQPKCMMNAFIPDCGFDREVYYLLTYEARAALLPLTTDESTEAGTHYELAAETQRQLPQPASFELDRVGTLVETLHTRFPGLDHNRLLSLILMVTGGILRDITMQNGNSYNCWLILNCFIDELALWLAHAGAFVQRPQRITPSQDTLVGNGSAVFTNGVTRASSGSDISGSNSQYGSIDMQMDGTNGGNQAGAGAQTNAALLGASHATFLPNNIPGVDPSFNPGNSPSRTSSPHDQNSAIDDSGLGLSLMEESDGKPISLTNVVLSTTTASFGILPDAIS